MKARVGQSIAFHADHTRLSSKYQVLEGNIMATLLKNCKIYDGTGADAFHGSVLIEILKLRYMIAGGQIIPKLTFQKITMST